MTKFNRELTVTFLLLWITYFLTYCLRKPLGIFKIYLENEFHLSQSELGWLDVSLLLPYSLVQILGSSCWDSIKPEHVLSVNLLVAALAMLLSSLVNDFGFYCLLVALSGAAQAPLWPACIKVITSHVDPSSFGILVGLLGTAPYAGATFSSAFVSKMTDLYGWRHSIFPIFIPCVITSLLLLFGVSTGSKNDIATKKSTQGQKISYAKMTSIKGVPEVTMAGFCLKFARYALYMWLPLFLTEHLNYSLMDAGIISCAFDIGGAIGGPLLGYYIDNTEEKLKIIYKGTLIGTLAMALFAFFGSSVGSILVSVLLLVIGICNCGPDSVLIGAITADMGNMDGLNAGAGVTSFVNGLASTGGILEGPILGILVKYFGWSSVLLAIVTSTLVAGLALVRADKITKWTKKTQQKTDPISKA